MAIKVTEEKMYGTMPVVYETTKSIKNMKKEELLEEAKQLLRKDYRVTETPDGEFEYKVYASYDDKIENEDLIKICDSEYPWEEFCELLDWAYDDGADGDIGEIVGDVINELEKKYNEPVPKRFEYDVWELIYAVLPEEHFLKQEVKIPIFIDTGDANYDFVLNTRYPAYDGDCGGEIPSKASIRWLAETQGYSESKLREALDSDLKKSSGKFLDSIYRELANCVSDLNPLVFLTKMTLEDAIKLNERMRECKKPNKEIIYNPEDRPDAGTIHISKDVECGLYDFWNGGGSVLEIELERDIDLPVKYIYSALPDGGCGYSVDKCYGLCGSSWKDVVTQI